MRPSMVGVMAWTLRAAQLGDVDAVLGLWTAAGAEPTHTDTHESLRRLVAHDNAALIVAEEGGAIVGSVIAAWDGWRGSVYRLVVARSHRRAGMGRQLLRAAEVRLSQVGAVRHQAIVVENEEGAVSFWRASGWEQQAERLRFVKG
jgi:ribosomal protein S18 acetylase RimI-like enzyme